MSSRPTPDPEVVPLLRAIKARIEGLGGVNTGPRDGLEIYQRNKTPFLQLEIRRDHMSLDLWLPTEQLDEARASGIARAHPFLGDEAVKVRFERAEDLSRVARWIEASFEYAPNRGKKSTKKVKAVESQKPIATPPPSGPEKPAVLPTSTPPTPASTKESSKPSSAKPDAKRNGAAAKKSKPAKASSARAKKSAKPVKRAKAKPAKKAPAKAKSKKAPAAKAKRSSARR
jgi:hypothetical protein